MIYITPCYDSIIKHRTHLVKILLTPCSTVVTTHDFYGTGIRENERRDSPTEMSINRGASFHPDALHVGKTSGRASSDERPTFR